MAEITKIINLAPPSSGKSVVQGLDKPDGSSDFASLLKKSIDEANTLQKDGEKAIVDIATGQVKDLHQAALAINKAETSMKLMLEIRNKAISAYKEILRTQV